MAQSGFQPYTYEQLYTTARDLTAAHNEQEAKLGALDAMAAGVEPYLDPEKHPEDQQMYDALQNYRKGLNDVTYHLASRGLNGHVYNNVMSLAADYSGKVKPIEGAVENYKKAHDMRVALMTQNPDYIPRYSWDDISISENLNGASQRAVEGFKGTQYMNDITTTLQKLFNDFGLTRRRDIHVLGHQIYNYISNGMPLKTALAWFADQTQMSNEDRTKMMLALGTIDKRYGVDEALESLNPSLSGYRTQGIINAIGTNEMKAFSIPMASGNGSGSRGLGAVPPLPSYLTVDYGQPFRPANQSEENRIDANRNAIIDKEHPFPSARIDVTDNTDPRSHGEVFYNEFYKRMKNYVGPDGKTHDYSRFAKWSPKKVFTNPEFPLIKGLTKGIEELAGLDIGAQEAYNQCWRQAVMQKGYYLNDEPTEVTTQVKPTINNFMISNKSEIYEINKDGSRANKPISTYKDTEINKFLDDAWQIGFSYIPSYYNVYPQLNGESGLGKNDKIFIKIYYGAQTKDFVASISSLLGKSKYDDLLTSTSSFNEYNPNGTDLFEEYIRVKGLDRLRESEVHIENAILDFAVGATKQTRKEEKDEE